MLHNIIIRENRLDEWVRSYAREAQGTIVELVFRLVAASCPNPTERRFPLADSIGQTGPDGILATDVGFPPFVPEGRSIWEIGTGGNAGRKATTDYWKRTTETPATERATSTFVFVTPHSGVHEWNQPMQKRWRRNRLARDGWRDVRIIDGTVLVDWLRQFPSTELWLAGEMGIHVDHVETPEQRWNLLRTYGEPPPLTPDVFLANRIEASAQLKAVFEGSLLQLRLDTHFQEQAVDFVAAWIGSLSDEAKADYSGRCLILTRAAEWKVITTLPQRHVLIADFHLNDDEPEGTRLLQMARNSGHAVIFGGTPGGLPYPYRVLINSPKSHQINDALEKAGYSKERARTVAQKCGGNLSTLLRLLQKLSLMPEWSQGSDAADLAIAVMLGSWEEGKESDREIVEKLSGKEYGEWIGTMREIAIRPGTPLIQREGIWKAIARYEGWHALGPNLFDEHLDRLGQVAVSVLRGRDPQFELPPDQRYAANIHGKVLAHSHSLRNGLAETLALLGSHPGALTSCTSGKAQVTAVLAVREILAEADWVLWASLDRLLPLLAEAAPGQFLDSVEDALGNKLCPFDTIFAQESGGIMGNNYLSGLLWALETLAWDAQYLTRVVVVLGELTARDPGGSYANRPANSLSTILLPWHPQTCAPVHKRLTAVETLQTELPDVAWKLLLNLLPKAHGVTMGSRKPAWREIIPDDWPNGSTVKEYLEQVSAYADLAARVAAQDTSKLADLIDRFQDLPPHVLERVLSHLRSDAVTSLPEADRAKLWTALIDCVSQHRKFSSAQWAMKPETVDKIAAVAANLKPDAPFYRHQRLFSERDFELYEERGKWEEQQRELDIRRQQGVNEVFTSGGVPAVQQFVGVVESPWRVGVAFGVVAPKQVIAEVLPSLLESETKSLAQFAGGFVRGRFHAHGWQWLDELDTSRWSPSEKGQLLAYLPFTPETWERSTRLLGPDEAPYWSNTSANPYETERGLELAAACLVKYGRAYSAIRCLGAVLLRKGTLDNKFTVEILNAVPSTSEDVRVADSHSIIEVIKALQEDQASNPDDLLGIEWAFLPLLDRHQGVSPKSLEQRLADDPDFFCEIIGFAFRPKEKDRPLEEPTIQQKNRARNAYDLLHVWRKIPGSKRDETFDGEALAPWIERVKAVCSESGHLEIAMQRIGHVLIHAPADPDGLWIHHSVAIALNAKEAEHMRIGFRTELFNSRGVHTYTAGIEERKLANEYRKQAEEVETRGYRRLADSLRDLAVDYEHQAEREASRDPYED